VLRVLAGVLVILVGGSRPASAQVDFSGIWAPIMHEDSIERAAGPDLGDYLGLPINDAGRLRGETWDAAILTMEEHTCKPHPSTYGFRGVGNLWITTTVDPTTYALTSINTHIQWMEQKREIWMDGRPHPPEFAPHTWQGFSTGRWEGNVLVVETTHLKAGWIRRNGLALSDRAHMTERFIRHGDLLTHVYIIEDPVYLSEPLIKTNGFRLTTDTTMAPYPCQPAVEVERPPGRVPSYLPGQNPYLTEFAEKNKLPVEATRGGAVTALPEFIKTMAGATSSRAGTATAASPRPAATTAPKPAPAGGAVDVRSWHVQGQVWLINAGAVNVAIQVGDEGVLVVDTGTAALADRILAEIQRLAGGKPIRYIINTSAHPDHTGGNVTIAKAGRSIIAGNFVAQAGPNAANAAKIIAHENTLRRMSLAAGGQPVAPEAAWPTDTFFTGRNDLFFNGEAVQMLYQPNAHSDNDVLVYFRKSDVIVTGDVYINSTFPVIDREGGSLEGLVAALGRIIEITVPRDKQEGGTYVIPGHGRIADEADVVEYFDMMAILRDRLQDAVKKGMSLMQVKTAGLSRDYEGRYGAPDGDSTTDAFIEAAYRSLSPAPAAPGAR
jgi:glyoxylase-like metal-dependent hydrolase (beta-lactamase superfamily II)